MPGYFGVLHIRYITQSSFYKEKSVREIKQFILGHTVSEHSWEGSEFTLTYHKEVHYDQD